MTHRFQVDLSGMVDLLSRHLYSGPQVYLRELLQNAVDAVTARGALDPAAEQRIRLYVSETENGVAELRVTDTGLGLTAEEAGELLATIGRSSKRDPELGLGRTEFIGQFGIGMLAAFMVADHIEVWSRSARQPDSTVHWVGHADGTFTVEQHPDSAHEIGTTVRLFARADMAHWLATDTVLSLAKDYGSLLPFDVAVSVPVEGSEPLWHRITQTELPWNISHPSDAARDRALTEYCETTFGFTPLAAVDLKLPLVGVTGVAFILPQAVSPGSGQHRVYTKRMLLGHRIDQVLPEWAFFTRAVIDTDMLSPTASREQLHDDEVLHQTRDALGEQLKSWAINTLSQRTQLAQKILETHHLALRAVALTDPSILDLVSRVLPFETTEGPLTLADAAAGGELLYTTTTEAYRRVAAVARAQGLVVVNAGYVYDSDLVTQLGRRAGWSVRELKNDDLVQVLSVPSVAREMEIAAAVSAARELLTEEDCDVIVRVFDPDHVPAILLRDAESERQRELQREREATPDLWGGLLDAFADTSSRRTRTLVLNDSAAVARQLLSAPRNDVFAAGLRSLYLSAVMLAGEGLRSRESAALSEALGVLLSSSLTASQQFPDSETSDE